jgi:protein-S-isoprenylcysteine O-methyltransferase Ste14
MTAAHLLFALVTAGYILVAIQLEEADLVSVHGDTYQRYRERVGMLLPRLRRRPRVSAVSGTLGARNPLA